MPAVSVNTFSVSSQILFLNLNIRFKHILVIEMFADISGVQTLAAR